MVECGSVRLMACLSDLISALEGQCLGIRLTTCLSSPTLVLEGWVWQHKTHSLSVWPSICLLTSIIPFPAILFYSPLDLTLLATVVSSASFLMTTKWHLEIIKKIWTHVVELWPFEIAHIVWAEPRRWERRWNKCIVILRYSLVFSDHIMPLQP